MVKQRYIGWILLATLILVSFWFRFIGISRGMSFWNDESQAALMSRGILQYGKPVTAIGTGSGVYQFALYYLTALAFRAGGINEIAGRFPSVISGTLLIGIVFFVTKKLFGVKQAVIAAFLTTFSQIQLAWSTQLRPYIWLELFTLLVAFFGYKFLENKKAFIDRNLILASGISIIAGLFHGTGLVNLAIIGLAVLVKIIQRRKFKYFFVFLTIGLIAAVLLFLSGQLTFQTILGFSLKTTHYRIFLTHNYLWLLVPAIIGSVFVYKKSLSLFLLFPVVVIFIFAFSNFKINPDYVRYSLPAFPLLYILFSEGVVRLKYIGLILGIACIFLAVKQEKILFTPKYYYSINADMRENPIVDYKTAFARIGQLIANKKDVVVMDAWNDRLPWYLPGQKFIFLVDGKGRTNDEFYGERMTGTVSEFEQQKVEYSSGVVIVENWPSLTPPVLQEHIRTTLKHEFDTNTVPGNESDPWSISVYSWGI